MKSMARHLGLLFLVGGTGILASACGAQALDGGSNDSPPRACDNRAVESTCADYPSGATRSDVEGSCDGTLSPSACPSQHAIGTCTATATSGRLSGRALVNTYYGDGPRAWTDTTAREACKTVNGAFISAADDGGSRLNRDLGELCDLDDQCKSGLTCHQNFVAEQCTAQKTCTLVCAGDAACQGVNPKGLCFKGCNNERICMLTP
ncbi:hypothetical protein BH11MYX4_BH11MYX4_27190 [soil metagenome]